MVEPSFTLQKFWFFIHPILRSFVLLHLLTTDLLDLNHQLLDEDEDAEEDEDDDDDDFQGPGAEGLRAVLGEMKQGGTGKQQNSWKDGGIVKGGEALAVIEEKLQRLSGSVHVPVLAGRSP